MITLPLKAVFVAATLVSSGTEVRNQHLLEIAKSICHELVAASSLPRQERIARLGPVFDRYSDKAGQVKFLAGPRWIKASDEGRRVFREWIENHIRSTVLGQVSFWRVEGCRAREAIPINQASLTLDLSMDTDRGDFVLSMQNIRQHFTVVFFDTREGFRIRDILWGSSVSMLITLKNEIQRMDNLGPLKVLEPDKRPQDWVYDKKFHP